MIVAITIDHSEVEDILMKEKDHQRERYPNRDRRPPRTGGLSNNRRPPDRYGGHSRGGGPPDGRGPLMIEGHLIEMEDPHNALIKEDPQDLEDLLDQ